MTIDEYIEVDVSLNSFADYKLFGLAELSGCANPSEIVEGGFNTKFANLVCALCNELAVLYSMEDKVTAVSSEEDIVGFQFDLSAILGELDCPLEIITCGPLEARFDSVHKRSILIDYLLSEMKCARLFASHSLESPASTSNERPLLLEAMSAVGLKMSPEEKTSQVEIINNLSKAANCSLQLCSVRPQPLLNAAMDAKRWNAVQQVAKTLATDCRSRMLLLLKRIDVTINSFLWSDRVRKHEEEIRDLFAARRARMSSVPIPDIACVLAASQNLLRIEQASSQKRRQNTRSKVHPLAMADQPQDRGGRTTLDDMTSQQSRIFTREVQPDQRGRGGYRGRGRGRGGNPHSPQKGRVEKNISHEQQVSNEYRMKQQGGSSPQQHGSPRGNRESPRGNRGSTRGNRGGRGRGGDEYHRGRGQ